MDVGGGLMIGVGGEKKRNKQKTGGKTRRQRIR